MKLVRGVIFHEICKKRLTYKSLSNGCMVQIMYLKAKKGESALIESKNFATQEPPYPIDYK